MGSRLTIADLPTFTILPLEPPGYLPLVRRDPGRFEKWQRKVVTFLAALGREMTHGEVSNYVLMSATSVERREVLDGLAEDGRILVRDEPRLGRAGESRRVYRLPSQEGGGR